MVERVYLDWNATAPLRPEARAAVTVVLDMVGNPSSVHGEGRAARRTIEQARTAVAALIGADAGDVIFTSGGTEANALALTPAIEVAGDKTPCSRLLLSAIEHPSVRAGGRFPAGATEEIPVTAAGMIDLAALDQRLAALAGTGRVLVSLMHANNETGVVQPVAAAAGLVHAAGGLLHVDAVQSAGKISCDIKALGADLLTLSAHKLGGPKGVGALVIGRAGIHADALLKGGGQERGARAGTENVSGIAGFGAAAEAAARALGIDAARVSSLRDRLEAGLKAASPDAVIFGAEAERLPNTTLVAVPGLKAETALIALDLDGLAVSAGSACSSGKVTPSHVLAAMSVEPGLARGAIRVSLGPTTTENEIGVFLKAWTKLAEGLSKGSKARRGLAA
jgi:cysteine desulfurase